MCATQSLAQHWLNGDPWLTNQTETHHPVVQGPALLLAGRVPHVHRDLELLVLDLDLDGFQLDHVVAVMNEMNEMNVMNVMNVRNVMNGYCQDKRPA